MTPPWFDTIALEVARKFTPIEDGQRRAQLQCAIVKAMSDAMALGARDRLFAQDEAWNQGRKRGFEAGYDAAMAGMSDPYSEKGYREAFYRIADLIGMHAMDCSPSYAFESVMLPKLRSLIAHGPRFGADKPHPKP